MGKLSHDQMLTSVEDAVRFVKDTGVDALAIAVGTSHGAYKFTRPPTGDVLRIDRIKEIHQALPNTHIVMHGSSSVPQEWLKVINEHGGKIGETYGVPVEEIVEASNTASAKSTSIPTCASPLPVPSAASWQKTHPNSTRANT